MCKGRTAKRYVVSANPLGTWCELIKNVNINDQAQTATDTSVGLGHELPVPIRHMSKVVASTPRTFTDCSTISSGLSRVGAVTFANFRTEESNRNAFASQPSARADPTRTARRISPIVYFITRGDTRRGDGGNILRKFSAEVRINVNGRGRVGGGRTRGRGSGQGGGRRGRGLWFYLAAAHAAGSRRVPSEEVTAARRPRPPAV